jgi:hypothetical protein
MLIHLLMSKWTDCLDDSFVDDDLPFKHTITTQISPSADLTTKERDVYHYSKHAFCSDVILELTPPQLKRFGSSYQGTIHRSPDFNYLLYFRTLEEMLKLLGLNESDRI